MLLSLGPVDVAAQEGDPHFDTELVLQLDLTEVPEPELEALHRAGTREVETRRAELPGFEVGPALLIPLGGATGIAALVTSLFRIEGPVEYAYAGAALGIGAGVLLLSGVIWWVERLVARGRNPNWHPYVRAQHAVRRLYGEHRRRVERARRAR